MRRAVPLRSTVCLSAVAALAAVGTLLAPAAFASEPAPPPSLLPLQPGLHEAPAPGKVRGVEALGRKWG